MIEHPIERHDRRVEFTHQVLSDIIDAVLVVPLVHLRNVLFQALNVGRNVDIVVLPDIVETVNGMGAHCRGRVSSADGFRISDGCEVVPDSEDIVRRDADLTVWVESMSTYALTVGRKICAYTA